MDDELRARLQAADPAHGDAPADSWIDDLVETTMNVESEIERRGLRRTWVMVAAAAAAVAVIGGGAVVLAGGDDDDNDRPAAQPEPRTELRLALPEPNAMQMCIAFSPEVLEPVPIAFSAVATEVDGTTVTLTPDHWYRGEETDVVILDAPSPDVLLEGGIVLEEGERYLISADGGQVASCGLSGPYTEEMAAAYAEAFGE